MRLVKTFLHRILLIYCVKNYFVCGCSYPDKLSLHSTIKFIPEADGLVRYPENSEAIYSCEHKYDMIGPKSRTCHNGTWLPPEMPFCVLNVAKDRPAFQSSGLEESSARKAVDGQSSDLWDPHTCTTTAFEVSPWWSVALSEAVTVQLVRVDFGQAYGSPTEPVTVTVKIGQNRPDLGDNSLCQEFVGPLTPSTPVYLSCLKAMLGSFVSVHLKSFNSGPIQLSICEVYVYKNHGKYCGSGWMSLIERKILWAPFAWQVRSRLDC